MTEHLLPTCPEECVMDSSEPILLKHACGECWRNPALPEKKRWMSMGDNIKIYTAYNGADVVIIDNKRIECKPSEHLTLSASIIEAVLKLFGK